MTRKALFFITIFIFCFMSCAQKTKPVFSKKSVTGMFAGVTPFELEIIVEKENEFSGILRWPSYKTWIYAEGRYSAPDSMIFAEKHYIFNEIFQNPLNEFRLKITDNSLEGESASGSKIFGVLKDDPRQLTEFENSAWKMITDELAARDEINELNNKIIAYYRKQNEVTDEEAVKLRFKVAKCALPIVKNGLEFLIQGDGKLDENSSIDTEVLQEEFKTRLGLLTRFALFDKDLRVKYQQLLDGLETNYPGYFVLSEKLFEAEISEKYKNKDYNDPEIIAQYQADKKSFYIEFSQKKLYYEDMVPFIFSFAYSVLEDNPEYQEYLWGEIIKLEANEKLDIGPQMERMKQTVQAIITTLKMKGQPSPPLTHGAIDGSFFDLANQKGKVVFLEFWATWCGPCKQVTPRLKSIYAKYKDNPDFVMVSVALDDLESTRQYIRENNMNWVQLVLAEDPWNSTPAKDYAIIGVPTAFLIDKNGILRDKLHPGDEDLENKIIELLK
ncbi:MAG: redoxin domain-containing protein [Candidatus Marinimicrobia bacterium]|nr:redoxin domain-containing protein [Candidatus Neomarinimicrobiota bacterium]